MVLMYPKANNKAFNPLIAPHRLLQPTHLPLCCHHMQLVAALGMGETRHPPLPGAPGTSAADSGAVDDVGWRGILCERTFRPISDKQELEAMVGGTPAGMGCCGVCMHSLSSCTCQLAAVVQACISHAEAIVCIH
jgi:hypothetical protein